MATKAAVIVPALPTRSPGLALLLSLLWPGIGQIYNGQIRKGMLLMLLYAMSLFLVSASAIGFLTTALLLVYGALSAHNAADHYARWVGGPQKLCPHCGKSIQAAANSCRLCGWVWRDEA